jgi:hypothetical protein
MHLSNCDLNQLLHDPEFLRQLLRILGQRFELGNGGFDVVLSTTETRRTLLKLFCAAVFKSL